MFKEKLELRIPGPAPVPPSVLRASARPMINHRGDEFKEMLPRLIERLKGVFRTENPVIPITGSGTAAMEAAAANLISPGDRVLVLVGGSFGDRWARICSAYGAQIDLLEYPWGSGVDPEQVRDRLRRRADITAVFCTHNESSTAVLNDLEGIAQARGDHQALLVVDAVSSLGGAPLETDRWGLDIVCTASQKCLMTPPGLSFVSISPRARQRMQESTGSRFYFDLRAYERSIAQGEPPFTPNLANFFALEQALDLIEAEGLENVFARHRLMRDMVRTGVAALGFPLLVEEKWASPTVTAVRPMGLDISAFRRAMVNRFGVEFAGGQGKLAGQIFRIGHMGYATPLDMLSALAALECYLGKYGVAVEAAENVWAGDSL